MRAGIVFAVALLGLLGLATSQVVATASADPPGVEERLSALGAAREGEEEIFEQLRRVLATADDASSAGDSARAERHRDLAEALVRGLDARRRATELRRRLAERELALAGARARLERAREAEAHAARDQVRLRESGVATTGAR